ncbi:TfpX/TfpZ family type IV pilin accessory protein [Uliginosibacterium sp. 31-16]|uniref:TfpX/TfpZ family type IV pilin accessory protein n=1 Tax=Uliginosibacterium sp. 31-16 TaxID=3068315 RepID=UPI00273FFEF9|nr:TfpX/TfpZ family type IV pilin accessory protein [Uliginosibacterium sp. 31-16]MDP5240604.1 TfpX/TfpZ family type IV pilin accessory protein [Uliginosibacterium sp. 31-16]
MITRKKLLAWHLSTSAVVVLAFVLFAVFVWCPPPLTSATGLTKILLTLFCVDVVLGPFLGFLFLKPERKSFRLDLIVIIGLQVVAFAYGAWTVYQGRPAYIVFAVDRFEIVSASQLETSELAKVSLSEFKSIPFLGTQYVFAEQPQNTEERNRILFSALNGADLQVFPQYYRPYAAHFQDVLAQSRTMNELLQFNPAAADVLANVVRKHEKKMEDVRYVPMAAKRQDLSVLVDAKNAEVLEVVSLRPWK